MTDKFDILIIGSGIAGLSAALAAAPKNVAVLTRGTFGEDGASRWAQGGIAAAIGRDDSAALHARDTLAAGQHLNDADSVRRLTEAAPDVVRWLRDVGAGFDLAGDGALALGREAAHSRSRIVHAQGDATGAELMRCLRVAAREAAHVSVYEHHEAVQLIRHGERVVGVRAITPDGESEILADHIVLATGGIGALYRYTTNPAAADGSGLSLALAAGAALADLEFVQFHPTALAPIGNAGGQLPLLTEALRGAGAVLVNDSGRRFMLAQSPQAELAPRDVVSRAVWAELQRGQGVYLDATAAVGAAFPQRFPTVFAACMARGIDPRITPVPVVPAQHYHMGGVRVDGFARTCVDGLYAVGEVACSGVHGANRLASNSLLEGLVFGRGLGQRLASASPVHSGAQAQRIDMKEDFSATPEHDSALADLLWQHVGLVRDEAGLRHAVHVLGEWAAQATSSRFRARAQLAKGIAAAALARRDNIGAHWRSDAMPALRTG